MRRLGLGIVMGVCLAATADAQRDIQLERVFGPEQPGRYKHPASITQLASGDLYLVYYGGSGEYGTDTAVHAAQKPLRGSAWTDPTIIADTPHRSEGNAVIWQAPDGLLWLFYVTRYGETWSTSRIKYKISVDAGKTWSDSHLLTLEQGMMVRSHPIVLEGGDYLLPIYHETGHDRERVGSDTTSLFLRRAQGQHAWQPTNRVRSRLGNLQPAVVQLDDQHLLAFCRRGGGYGPLADGFIVRTESRDGGFTWSDGVDTQFPNPNAAIDLIKLENGHLLVVYNNNNQGRRMPLTVAISTDQGQTWPHARNLVDRENDTAAYPSAMQTRDGRIHVIYTSRERTVINHAVFSEAAILGE